MIGRFSSSSPGSVMLLLVKISAIITLINLVMTISLLMSWRQAISHTTAGKRTPQRTRELQAKNSSSETIGSAWFREQLASQGRDFYVDRESVLAVGPNAPMLQFQPKTTESSDKTEQGGVLSWLSSRMGSEVGDSLSHEVSLKTKASDVYFSVRTTYDNHHQRLPLLLDTWIALIPRQVRILTDLADEKLEKELKQRYSNQRPQLIAVDCPQASHSKWSLLCKIYWEYQYYMSTQQKESWFCHFDDDTYVNVKELLLLLDNFDPSKPVYLGKAPSRDRATKTIAYNTRKKKYHRASKDSEVYVDEAQLVFFHFALGGAGICLSEQLAAEMFPYFEGSNLVRAASSISLPDDCVLGYVITHQMNVSLVNVDRMHSHIEDMSGFDLDSLSGEVTFSYKRDSSRARVANQTSQSHDENLDVEDTSAIRLLHKLMYDPSR